MPAIPGVKTRSWYDRQALAEAVSSVPPLITSVLAAASGMAGQKKPHEVALWLFAAAAWLGVGSLWKIRLAAAQDAEKGEEQSPDGLAGCTEVLYRILKERSGLGTPGDFTDGILRITIHRLAPPRRPSDEPDLEQVLPYVGGQGGPAGRHFSLKSGLAGLVARNALAGHPKATALQRQNDDYGAFLEELRTQWSYTDAEARALTPDRQAWMSVPIMDSAQSLMGVVYLDSSVKGFFTLEAQTLVIHACYGITQYVEERYK